MQIQQLHSNFVAEIVNLDTAVPPTPEVKAAFEDAMNTYAVCVIRNASLKDVDHIRFCRAFGPLELPPPGRGRIARELWDNSNLDMNGEIIPREPKLPMMVRKFDRFHTDSPFNALPTKWSVMVGHIVPPADADTMFIDTRAVYEDLPETLKVKIDHLSVDHDLSRARERKGITFNNAKIGKLAPSMTHPLVRTSASGRKALYIGWHAVRIRDWAQEEGEELLDDLYELATQAKYIYSHKWRQGDMVVWDNRCTMHSATPFDGSRYKRDVRLAIISEYGQEVCATSTDAI